MPELDGYETARLVRRTRGPANIPIVFITAYGARTSTVQAGYASGAVDTSSSRSRPTCCAPRWPPSSTSTAPTGSWRSRRSSSAQHERREHALALGQLELQSLRRQEAAQRRYRTLLEGITHAVVWVVDPTTLVCRFASPSAEALLGHPPERLTGDAGPVALLAAPRDRQRFLAAVAALEPGSAGATLQHRFVRADGSAAWFETALRLLPSEDSERLELRGFSVEITEVVEARAALELLARASAELFSSLDTRAVVERAAAMGLGLADGCVVEVRRATAAGGERGVEDGPAPIVDAPRARAVGPARRPRAARRVRRAGGARRERPGGDRRPGRPARRGERPGARARPREAGAGGDDPRPARRARGAARHPLALLGGRALAPRRDLAVAEELGGASRRRWRTRGSTARRARRSSSASGSCRSPRTSSGPAGRAPAPGARARTGRDAAAGIPVPDVLAPELTRRIRGAVRQVERLGSLVSSLFDLARIRSGRLTLERGAVRPRRHRPRGGRAVRGPAGRQGARPRHRRRRSRWSGCGTAGGWTRRSPTWSRTR